MRASNGLEIAITQPVQTLDHETGISSREFMISFQQSPTFKDKETAEWVAGEINEVLERSGG